MRYKNCMIPILFGYGSVFDIDDLKLQSVFNHDNLENIISVLIKNGTKLYKKGKRKVCMTLYGSTMGVSQTPRIVVKGKVEYIPRPYTRSKPSSKWLKRIHMEDNLVYLVQYLDRFALQYLEVLFHTEFWSREIYNCLLDSKKYIPSSCRIFDTSFTFMSINGDMKDSQDGISLHIDEDDCFNIVIHIGKCTKGGSTIYVNTRSNNIDMKIPFQNGQIQIGCFSEVLHGTEPWMGQRCSINLGLKRNVLNHFKSYGTKYFHYVSDNNFECPNIKHFFS